MTVNTGPEKLSQLIKKRTIKKPPAYRWQDLALRVIEELAIPKSKRNSVFKVCKDNSKNYVELRNCPDYCNPRDAALRISHQAKLQGPGFVPAGTTGPQRKTLHAHYMTNRDWRNVKARGRRMTHVRRQNASEVVLPALTRRFLRIPDRLQRAHKHAGSLTIR